MHILAHTRVCTCFLRCLRYSREEPVMEGGCFCFRDEEMEINSTLI